MKTRKIDWDIHCEQVQRSFNDGFNAGKKETEEAILKDVHTKMNYTRVAILQSAATALDAIAHTICAIEKNNPQ